MMGKNRVTKWRRMADVKTVRNHSYNIVSHLPGALNRGKDAKLPIEYVSIYF